MISISEKGAVKLGSAAGEVKIKYSAASDCNMLKNYLDYLALSHSFINLSYIGTSAEGRAIPVVSMGKNPESGGAVYVGGIRSHDLVSPAVMLRFICDYADFLEAGRRIYGISMPYLWENRTIHVIPMLNPDGYMIRRDGFSKSLICDRLKKINSDDGYSENDFSNWRYNALGRDLAVSFDNNDIPEIDALKNYLNLYADTIDLVIDIGMDSGIVYSSGRTTPARAKTVARLISRMSGYRLSEHIPENKTQTGTLTDYVIKTLKKSAYHCGCLDEGETLPKDGEDYIKVYAAMREALFSCPLL